MEDFLPRQAWPQEVVAIDAAGADPTQRNARAADALSALKRLTDARLEALNAPVALLDGQAGPSHGQLVQRAIERIKLLLGKDFPVRPRFSLGPYASQFNASLGEQGPLTRDNAWQIAGWIPKLARVREGLHRFSAALSAHEALIDMSTSAHFKLVRYPHRSGQAWAALPEAWRDEEATAPDLTQVPEELTQYVSTHLGATYKDINRAAPNMAVAMHTPGGRNAVQADGPLAGLLVDEWAEFVPDPFQTAAVAFHYDAPGARPPQSIILAVPPNANQENWTFDDVLDVLHEARVTSDAARSATAGSRRRARQQVLPGNYLPQSYTDDLPSVQLLKLQRDAASVLAQRMTVQTQATIALGKV